MTTSDSQERLKVLLLAPYYSREVAGESWSTYHWVKGISEYCDTTVLTMHQEGWDETESPTQAKEVVNWTDLKLPKKLQRLGWELKPGYIVFYRKARKWILSRLSEGWDFDLVHQINPLALRYPCPMAGLGQPYLMGPLAGSLPTPPGFAGESTDKQLFRKLRAFDKLRFKHDPLMKRSYAGAAMILGVAPYVQNLIAHLKPARFEMMSETGIEALPHLAEEPLVKDGILRLLFVGRIIRTKGVIDAIRALARIQDRSKVRFDIVGEGDSLEICRAEVDRLELDDCVYFHGRLPREEVNEWYRKADVFFFPSFREPSGNVVFEALSYGLPIITSAEGGPGYVVDESCGFCVPAIDPEQYVEALTEVLQEILEDPKKLERLSKGALARVSDLAIWEHKIRQLMLYYREILQDSPQNLSA